MEESEKEAPVAFKKRNRKNVRARNVDPEDTDDKESTTDANNDDDLTEKMELFKELRKLRQRPHGVSAVALALGKKVADEEVLSNDPFKTQCGGMIDMDSLKSGNFQAKDDAYDTGIGTQFSAETNTRDEDAEMLKYIEEKLHEYKKATATKKRTSDESDDQMDTKFLSPEDAALMALPDYLRQSSSTRSEEMLSNQMLSGIPEVDLGIEVKIRNIEATEEAKQKILRDRLNKKEGPSVFVPTNMAVNFVQHNRFNIEDPMTSHAHKRQRVEKETPKLKKVVVVGAEPEEIGVGPVEKERGEKATDDMHFEKFKKQFRRF